MLEAFALDMHDYVVVLRDCNSGHLQTRHKKEVNAVLASHVVSPLYCFHCTAYILEWINLGIRPLENVRSYLQSAKWYSISEYLILVGSVSSL